jgi:hypothetical protein
LQEIEENKGENIFEESERLESSKNNEVSDEEKDDDRLDLSRPRVYSVEEERIVENVNPFI